MKTSLMVPVHLDALLLQTPRPVAPPMADFSRLPYLREDGSEVHVNQPHLGSTVSSKPLDEDRHFLRRGVHLHWALPKPLTLGNNDGNATEFPAVPNRWLVTRRSASEQFEQWIVESDYVFQAGKGLETAGTSFPTGTDSEAGHYQPFRIVGRKLPLNAWPGDTGDYGNEYLEKLTAVGYGEPSFAAFYPNCASVFGFHDPEGHLHAADERIYEVLGWYSDKSNDFLGLWQAQFIAQFTEQNGEAPSQTTILAEMEEQLGWQAEMAGGDELPQRMFCYAQVNIQESAAQTPHPDRADGSVKVTVGNTANEAMSAHLASLIDPTKKDSIEDQLESILMGSRLTQRSIDIGPKFQEERHDESFKSVDEGFFWSLRLEGAAPSASSLNDENTVPLPGDHLAELMNHVNVLQDRYDKGRAKIRSLQARIYDDWNKYMMASYPEEQLHNQLPDPDLIRYFIEFRQIPELQKVREELGEVALEFDEEQNLSAAQAGSSGPYSLANELTDALNQLLGELQSHHATHLPEENQQRWVLQRRAGVRYWEPREPVVLLTGESIRTSERHHLNGALDCSLFRSEGPYSELAFITYQPQLTLRISELGQLEKPGFFDAAHHPWHPFLLEWEADVLPIERSGNLLPDTRNYQSDFITANFQIPVNSPELKLQAERGRVRKAVNRYQGSSLLTPVAGKRVRTGLEDWLLHRIWDLFRDFEAAAGREVEAEEPDRPLEDLVSWYQTHSGSLPQNEVIERAILALDELDKPENRNLCQALGGFNKALLMQNQTLQLGIEDPLAFETHRKFSREKVRLAVGSEIRSAPLPQNDFNPIRSGAMKLLRLRLIDTFGQVHDLPTDEVHSTSSLRMEENPGLLNLPPRIVQAARLNFRWLSAGTEEQQMNEHPASSPICGWFAHNLLDDNLVVYDQAGQVLGSIEPDVQWLSAPGKPVISPADIRDIHLKKVVQNLLNQSAHDLGRFREHVDTALNQIEPENSSQHPGLSLLTGRPMALTRASINLELAGMPALNQSWPSLRHDLQQLKRESDSFTQIEFPLRLGDKLQFGDGLVCFWKTDEQENPLDVTFSHFDSDVPSLTQSIDAKPEVLLMLSDPRASLHLTSGILPVKAIQLPPDQFQSALKNMEISFLVAPLLSGQSGLRVSLPGESGFEWDWLEKKGEEWTSISKTGKLGRSELESAFPSETNVWNDLLAAGWIRTETSGFASIVGEDDPDRAELPEGLRSLENEILDFFASHRILSEETTANFPYTTRIREGYLRLSPLESL